MTDNYDEDSSTEIRYLTLELMKLAANKKKSFRSVLSEYIDNTYILCNALEDLDARENGTKPAPKRKISSEK